MSSKKSMNLWDLPPKKTKLWTLNLIPSNLAKKGDFLFLMEPYQNLVIGRIALTEVALIRGPPVLEVSYENEKKIAVSDWA